MTPNLAAGKTEIVMSLCGPGSRTLKQQFYGLHGGGRFPVITEHGLHHIRVVPRYKHLGGCLHHAGDQRQEARQRLAVAHATFTQQRRCLYANTSNFP